MSGWDDAIKASAALPEVNPPDPTGPWRHHFIIMQNFYHRNNAPLMVRGIPSDANARPIGYFHTQEAAIRFCEEKYAEMKKKTQAFFGEDKPLKPPVRR